MKNHAGELAGYIGLPALVVDDDGASREIIVDFLKELGFNEIIEKTDGNEAFEYLESNKSWRGIVLCDWNMPQMSGPDLFDKVKAKHPDIPFILVTGRNDEKSVSFAKDTGIYAYILKPFSIIELEKKIHKVSSKHSNYLYDPAHLMVRKTEDAYSA